MSYSLNLPSCFSCNKQKTCTDRHVLQGAVSIIHLMPFGVGHLGSGSITMQCYNLEVAKTEDLIGG